MKEYEDQELRRAIEENNRVNQFGGVYGGDLEDELIQQAILENDLANGVNGLQGQDLEEAMIQQAIAENLMDNDKNGEIEVDDDQNNLINEEYPENDIQAGGDQNIINEENKADNSQANKPQEPKKGPLFIQNVYKRLTPEEEMNQLAFIFSHFQDPNGAIDISDRGLNYFLDSSPDRVGYEYRLNTILGRLGENLEDEEFTAMLTRIKKSPYLREVAVLMTRYANSTIVKEHFKDFLVAFTGKQEGKDAPEEDVERAVANISEALYARMKAVHANPADVEDELNQTHSLVKDLDYKNAFAAYHEINQLIMNARNEERVKLTLNNAEALKNEFDRAAWEHENDNLGKRMQIILGVIGDQLNDDEYEVLLMNLGYNSEMKKDLENCVKYLTFDQVSKSRFALQAYFRQDTKPTGMDVKTARELILKQFEEKKREADEVKKAEEEHKKIEEDLRKAKLQNFENMMQDNPFDEEYDNEYEFYNDGGMNEPEENLNINNINNDQSNNVQGVKANEPAQISLKEKENMKRFLTGYKNYQEGVSSMANKMIDFRNALGRTQEDSDANFREEAGVEGSDSYQAMAKAVKTLMDNLYDGNVKSDVVMRNFKALYVAASNYYDEHYGIFGIKGTDRGADRLEISRQIMKAVPVMINNFNNLCAGVCNIKDDEGVMFGKKTKLEICAKAHEIKTLLGPNIENDRCMRCQPYQQQMNASRMQLKLREKIRGISQTFARNYTYVGTVGDYENIKPNMTDLDKAKYYTLKKYADQAFVPGVDFGAVRDTIVKFSGGFVKDEFKQLAKNEEFKACMRRHPQKGLAEWKKIEDKTDILINRYEGKLAGFTRVFGVYAAENSAFLQTLNGNPTQAEMRHVKEIQDDVVDVVVGKIVRNDYYRPLVNKLVTKPEKMDDLKICIRNAVVQKYGETFNRDGRGVNTAKLMSIFQNPNLTERAVRDFQNREAAASRQNAQAMHP